MKEIIIFDLDGTLSLTEHRQHFLTQTPVDWDNFYSACDQDPPNEAIVELNKMLASGSYKIYILTGRRESVRDKTLEWMERHEISFSELIMRPDGNFKPDEMLKEKWVDEIGPERVLFAVEDRKRVVDMWRRKGITCLQVSEGNF